MMAKSVSDPPEARRLPFTLAQAVNLRPRQQRFQCETGELAPVNRGRPLGMSRYSRLASSCYVLGSLPRLAIAAPLAESFAIWRRPVVNAARARFPLKSRSGHCPSVLVQIDPLQYPLDGSEGRGYLLGAGAPLSTQRVPRIGRVLAPGLSTFRSTHLLRCLVKPRSRRRSSRDRLQSVAVTKKNRPSGARKPLRVSCRTGDHGGTRTTHKEATRTGEGSTGTWRL